MPNIVKLFDGDEFNFSVDEQGNTWLRAIDCCRKLDIQNVSQAVSRLKDSQKLKRREIDKIGKPHDILYISTEGYEKLKHTSRKDATVIPGVYFIQCGENGPVKIGIARNIKERLMGIQCCNPYPVTLLRFIPGAGKKTEDALHAEFRSNHIHGEWFRYSRKLKSAINNSRRWANYELSLDLAI